MRLGDRTSANDAQPFSRAWIADMRTKGGFITDGPLPDDFSNGWAIHPFVGQGGKKAHWWRRLENRMVTTSHGTVPATGWRSLCGIDTVTGGVASMLARGNYGQCQRCMPVFRRLQR